MLPLLELAPAASGLLLVGFFAIPAARQRHKAARAAITRWAEENHLRLESVHIDRFHLGPFRSVHRSAMIFAITAHDRYDNLQRGWICWNEQRGDTTIRAEWQRQRPQRSRSNY